METFQLTLEEIAGNIIKISKLIDEVNLKKFIRLISDSKRIFIYGAGRSGFIGRCLAQRLMHIGFDSCFISDAVTKRYTTLDCVILISGSGNTISTNAISREAKKIGGKIILITSNPGCEIAKMADLIIDLKSKTKISKEKSLAPYTSLFDSATLAFSDAIARVIMNEQDIQEDEINLRHASLE